MQQLWTKYAPYWHICTTIIAIIITAIWWVHDVNGSVVDVQTIKGNQETQATAIAVLQEESHETHEQVHDIWQAMRLDRMKK